MGCLGSFQKWPTREENFSEFYLLERDAVSFEISFESRENALLFLPTKLSNSGTKITSCGKSEG
jgi:hypothetical protein